MSLNNMISGCKHSNSTSDSHFASPNYKEINVENRSRDAWQKPSLVIEALGDISQKTIADIGAGTGYFTFRLAMKAHRVIAIDIDKDMIDLIEAFKVNLPLDLKDKIITRLAEDTDPHINPNEADIVMLINTITYLKNKDSYIKNLYNLLPEDGIVVVVDYRLLSMPLQTEQGDYKINPDELVDMFTNAGFKQVTVDINTLEYQYILKAEKSPKKDTI